MAARAGPHIRLSTIRQRRRMRGRARASKSARWRFSDPTFRGAPLARARNDKLPLRELEAAARLGPAVLLALDDARVAGEEAAALEHAAQIRLVPHQCFGKAVANRTGLAGEAAAGHRAADVILALPIGSDERLLNQHAQHRPRKISFHRAAVDLDLAAAHF